MVINIVTSSTAVESQEAQHRPKLGSYQRFEQVSQLYLVSSELDTQVMPLTVTFSQGKVYSLFIVPEKPWFIVTSKKINLLFPILFPISGAAYFSFLLFLLFSFLASPAFYFVGYNVESGSLGVSK